MSKLEANEMQGKIVYIQVASQEAKNIPVTSRFIGLDPLMACGADEYAVVECIKSENIYIVGTKYYIKPSRKPPCCSRGRNAIHIDKTFQYAILVP
jgi:hypothetical protein